jgi:hypothetical protein
MVNDDYKTILTKNLTKDDLPTGNLAAFVLSRSRGGNRLDV